MHLKVRVNTMKHRRIYKKYFNDLGLERFLKYTESMNYKNFLKSIIWISLQLKLLLFKRDLGNLKSSPRL